MRYKIGDIVRVYNENNAYVVLCSREQTLNEQFLKLNPNSKIKNIAKIAKNVLTTQIGFDYTISMIVDWNDDLYILDDELINVSENILSQ